MFGNVARTIYSTAVNRVIPAAVEKGRVGYRKSVVQITNNSIALGKPALPPKPVELCEKRQSLAHVKSAIVSVNKLKSKFEQSALSQPHRQSVKRNVGQLFYPKYAEVIECEKAKPDGRAGFTTHHIKTKPVDVTKSSPTVNPEVKAEGQSQSIHAPSPTVVQKNGQGVPPPPPWLDILPTVRLAPLSVDNSATDNSVPTIKISSKPSPMSGEKLFSADLMSDLNAALETLAAKKKPPQ